MKKRIAYLFLLTMVLARPVFGEEPGHPLLEKAKKMRAPRYQFALENGAQIGLTQEGKSFYVLWIPEGADPENPPPMVVTISGHSGWVFDEFYIWHHFLKERGYGFMAVQWWLGEGEKISDYLLPNEIYRVVDEVFKKENIKPGAALLHGFSRGSTNTYAVAAMDKSQGNHYFALIIANAGRPNSDYPPTRQIEEGRFGGNPLQGTRWVTFAGGKDPNPNRDGIEGMREAQSWIQKYGGQIELAIEDPEAEHGGFHRNPKNTNAALDVFDQLLSVD
jgi:hypothetical protein